MRNHVTLVHFEGVPIHVEPTLNLPFESTLKNRSESKIGNSRSTRVEHESKVDHEDPPLII